MHLFFDTVWKLHIGEIPEKPDFGGRSALTKEEGDLRMKYLQAIAAIKQNALTVENWPIIDASDFVEKGGLKPGEFYKWPGGYETLKTLHCDEYHQHTKNSCFTTVAILTLPEEKKNTMENMTEKDLAIKMANRALNVPYADPDSDICTISRQFLRALELTSSGSVAAPKEEEKDSEATPISFKDILRVHSINTEYVAAAEKWYATSAPLSYFEAAFKMYADPELASLRQQLEQKTIALDSYYKLAAEVAPLKEALKELLEGLENLNSYAPDFPEYPNSLSQFDLGLSKASKDAKAIIERARKTLNKEF